MKKRLSIKNKLVIYFGILLVTGLSICGFVANKICKMMIEEYALKNLASLATETADKINIILGEKREEVEKLATIAVLTDEHVSVEEKLTVITDFNEILCFKDMALVDLEGNYYSTRGLRGNIAGLPEFEKALQGEVAFSPKIKLEDEKVYTIAVPLISNQGQIIGAVMGIEDTKSFTYVLAEAGVSNAFMILDSKKNIVEYSNREVLNEYKRVDQTENLLESTDFHWVYEQMLAGENGVDYWANSETGEKNYISYAPINIGWSIALVNDGKIVLSALNEFNYGLFVTTTIIILLGLVGVYFVARRIANRINEITNYLDIVAHGDFEQPVPKNLLELRDEMGDAARALDGMKSEIEEMIGTIKSYTDYINDQVEDLTDGVKNELKAVLVSDEIDEEEREHVIERLNMLNQITQHVNQLDPSELHHSELNSKWNNK